MDCISVLVFRCPEMGTNSIDCAQLSRFLPGLETAHSPKRRFYVKIRSLIMFRNRIIVLIYYRHKLLDLVNVKFCSYTRPIYGLLLEVIYCLILTSRVYTYDWNIFCKWGCRKMEFDRSIINTGKRKDSFFIHPTNHVTLHARTGSHRVTKKTNWSYLWKSSGFANVWKNGGPEIDAIKQLTVKQSKYVKAIRRVFVRKARLKYRSEFLRI